jgi:iron complex transport system substrate-binding protein
MKDVRLWITVAAGLLLIAVAFGVRMVHSPATGEAKPGDYRRIVSLAPSLTETLFALDLGDRVVGVTRYCTWPPEAAERPKVGGFIDLDAEAVVRLDPDLLIAFSENDQALRIARGLGVPVLTLKHGRLDDILESIRTIGRTCGAERRAETLYQDMRERIERLGRATAGLPRVRVLVVLGRERGAGTIRDVTVAGKDALYDRMLEIAGAANACEQSKPAYPVLSAETILRTDPEIIVELAPEIAQGKLSADAVRDDWKPLGAVSAVRNDRVIVLVEDDVTKPGPRIVDGIERLARTIHPELSLPPPGEGQGEGNGE